MKRWLRKFGIVLGALLIGPILIPIPPLKRVVAPKKLAKSESQFMEIDGIEVHYQDRGEGTPILLLLHGFMANVFTWREALKPLSQIGRVIAYDRPAFGLTERPMPEDWPGENPYTIESQDRLLIHLIDQLDTERVVLVGHSAGGTQALYTYLNHPDRVEALILVAPAVYFGSGTPGWSKPLLKTPQSRRLGPLLVRSMPLWGKSLLDLAWHDSSRIKPEAIEEYSLPIQTENWDRALWEYTLASRELDLDTRLNEVQVPTLVITGDDDRIVPTRQSVRLAQEIPGAELVVLSNCGHMPQEECPQDFLDAVNVFLRSKA
jgi:pimeloyl-ACP methyl ester carboxylesterase